MLWVWWLRPTAAPLVWAHLAAAMRDVEACLADGRTAVERLAHHASRLTALAPPGDADAAFVVESARYLHGCLGVALAVRELFLPAFVAAHCGDRRAWRAACTTAPGTCAVLTAHLAAWGRRADFPALELDEVLEYLRRLERAPGQQWLQARVSALLVQRLTSQGVPVRRLRALGVGVLALTAMGAWRSPSVRPAIEGAAVWLWAAWPLLGPAVRGALPALSRRYHLLPSIFFEAGPSFTEWTG